MSSNGKLYKSFYKRKPYKAVEYKSGLEVSPDCVTDLIARDVTFITEIANWYLRNEITIREDVRNCGASQNSAIGRLLGLDIGSSLMKSFFKGKSGLSRYNDLFRDKVIREVKSWDNRSRVANNEYEAYVSQGWRRTANSSRPDDIKPKFSLSATNKQFSEILNNPFEDNEIHLKMVINGEWHVLYFEFDNSRFQGGDKVCLPDVRVENNTVYFDFSVEYEYVFSDFSSDYVVGVDAGKNKFATAVVWNRATGDMSHVYVMSHRANSLQNSIRATERQIRDLQDLGRKEEASLHRKANSRKKRELAILVAQEISDVASVFDNAIIAVEDLSWIDNTMKNGRWNRGELVKWITHFHELNGGRVIKVNAAYTSQKCAYCGATVTHPKWSISRCAKCGDMDRDVNASANIAIVPIEKGTIDKMIETRKNAKRNTGRRVRRTPTTKSTLKYPGRDRTKNLPTPKKAKQKINKEKIKEEVNNTKCSLTCNDDILVVRDSREYALTRTLKKQHDFELNDSYMLNSECRIS